MRSNDALPIPWTFYSALFVLGFLLLVLALALSV